MDLLTSRIVQINRRLAPIRNPGVEKVGENAIYANACFATAIDENYIEDFGDSGNSHTWYGIACSVQGGASSIISESKVFMLNGEPSGSTFVYIGVPHVNYGVGQLSVVNNSIRGAGVKGDIGLDYQLNGGSGLNLLSSNKAVEQRAHGTFRGRRRQTGDYVLATAGDRAASAFGSITDVLNLPVLVSLSGPVRAQETGAGVNDRIRVLPTGYLAETQEEGPPAD